MQLKDKTIVITGSSRGIGLAMARRFAQEGAKLVITGKTDSEHPKLPGTIHTASKEVEEAGGKAIAVKMDIRKEEEIEAMIEKATTIFGGIDILINNASAISLTSTANTETKRFDLMHQVNSRGTFLTSRLALPHLKRSDNPHILNISPPLNLNPRWFGPHLAYTMAKYGMSMCTLGMAEELREEGIAVNSLWPETGIATSAVKNLLGGEQAMKCCRIPAVVADAAAIILKMPARSYTGQFLIDSEVLKGNGVTDLEKYSIDKSSKLMKDFFLD